MLSCRLTLMEHVSCAHTRRPMWMVALSQVASVVLVFFSFSLAPSITSWLFPPLIFPSFLIPCSFLTCLSVSVTTLSVCSSTSSQSISPSSTIPHFLTFMPTYPIVRFLSLFYPLSALSSHRLPFLLSFIQIFFLSVFWLSSTTLFSVTLPPSPLLSIMHHLSFFLSSLFSSLKVSGD